MAAMPSPRPMAPRPSLVVALTATRAAGRPRAAAMRSRMEKTWGAIFGASAMTVASMLLIRAPRARAKLAAFSRISKLLIPRMEGSVLGK